ncbi:MAG: hypothetical protein KA717_01455 [Woronichinia naegeliana WA131]|uniref:Uncharacterized protein n=1 Tax=Woronichinia naegeliana WA131 TaxID=2824559 RepID=A0A977KXE2_9CYAN|nr:MAG: hypothetical protein KA717_01455 [Woronichinia naegeliana WA131]
MFFKSLKGLLCLKLRIAELLKTRGILTRYEVLDKQLLIPLDGTEYFSSQNIHCEQCSHRTHKNGTVTYFHSAILPVIVSPQQKAVISLSNSQF